MSLGKSHQWDRAMAQSLEFVQQHRTTVWEPRGLYWLGRLYLAAPHQGWRVGKKLHRGNDVPKTTANERPEQVYLQEQDGLNSHDALEAARVLFNTHHGHADEEIQLNFDLARVLEQDPRFAIWATADNPGPGIISPRDRGTAGDAKKWLAPDDPYWRLDL